MNSKRIILSDESAVPTSERFNELIIHKFPFRIGRRKTANESPPAFGLKENDLYLAESKQPYRASRNHVEIGVSSGSVYVRDLGSVNGTIVNGLSMRDKRREQSTLLLQKKDNTLQLGKPDSPWKFRLTIPTEERRYRMVIADDNPEMIGILKEVFKDEYDVITTVNGEGALQACLTQDPDIAVLDWEMPKLEGIAVCKHLKCNLRTSNLPVIILTGRRDVVDRITGIEVGADDYIMKPPDLAELKTRVNGELARSLHARDIHWLTGIASEAAVRSEINELLRAATAKKEFEFMKITLKNLGIMDENQGSIMTDKLLQRIAEVLWSETVKHERTVVGQLQISQWALLTPSGNQRAVKKSIKSGLGLVTEGTPLRFAIKSCSSAAYTNYYDLLNAL